jgi:hypothetical protein
MELADLISERCLQVLVAADIPHVHWQTHPGCDFWRSIYRLCPNTLVATFRAVYSRAFRISMHLGQKQYRLCPNTMVSIPEHSAYRCILVKSNFTSLVAISEQRSSTLYAACSCPAMAIMGAHQTSMCEYMAPSKLSPRQ